MHSSVDLSVWAERPEIYAHLENGIGFIALNRPKALNALSTSMVRGLWQALEAWRDESGVLAVVIYSPHPKAFCAVPGSVHHALAELVQTAASTEIAAPATADRGQRHHGLLPQS